MLPLSLNMPPTIMLLGIVSCNMSFLQFFLKMVLLCLLFILLCAVIVFNCLFGLTDLLFSFVPQFLFIAKYLFGVSFFVKAELPCVACRRPYASHRRLEAIPDLCLLHRWYLSWVWEEQGRNRWFWSNVDAEGCTAWISKVSNKRLWGSKFSQSLSDWYEGHGDS